MWKCAPRCGDLVRIIVRCEMWYTVECCNFCQGVIEMQNVLRGLCRDVECGVLVCEMLPNAKCVKL